MWIILDITPYYEASTTPLVTLQYTAVVGGYGDYDQVLLSYGGTRTRTVVGNTFLVHSLFETGSIKTAILKCLAILVRDQPASNISTAL